MRSLGSLYTNYLNGFNEIYRLLVLVYYLSKIGYLMSSYASSESDLQGNLGDIQK